MGFRRLIPVFLIILQTACGPAPRIVYYQPWDYADLRAVGAADAAIPELDLVAVSMRQIGTEQQIRLDLLDLSPQVDYDLYLAFDNAPGGTTTLPLQVTAALEWDVLLAFLAEGEVKAFQPGAAGEDGYIPLAGLGLRLMRDPVQDTLIIGVDHTALTRAVPGSAGLAFDLQIFLAPAGTLEPADVLGPVSSAGPPPPPARVLLAFWNSLPAYTPAQALRRWDGAHTGPLGGRHGLYNLLRTARSKRTPVVLLDLKSPASLAALDALGGLNMVQSMAAAGQLVLPETLPAFPQAVESTAPAPLVSSPLAAPPGWAIERALTEHRQVGITFGLPASPFLYLPSETVIPLAGSAADRQVVFIPFMAGESELQPVMPYRWRSGRAIPIPVSKAVTQQVTSAGLALEVRRALVRTAGLAGAARPGMEPFLVLGGDLPASAWGNPGIARTALDYLATRPWLKLLSAHDLLTSQPASTAPASGEPPDRVSQAPVMNELAYAPSNPLSTAAWQAYLALLTPLSPNPTELLALRANYLGQVDMLLAAARWAEDDSSQAACHDIDHDGGQECVLASSDFFALFEKDSAVLAYAFTRTPGGVHQLIGPSSQLGVGWSDPTTWDLSQGMLSDPAVIPGAFAGQPGEVYQTDIAAGSLAFTSVDNTHRKIFRLIPGGLSVKYHSSSPHLVRIPLVLDPWERFAPGWSSRYLQKQMPGSWLFELAPTLRVEIKTAAPVQVYPFTESQRYFKEPEDPNRDYPTGHFQPFPLTLVEVSSPGDLYLEIQVIP